MSQASLQNLGEKSQPTTAQTSATPPRNDQPGVRSRSTIRLIPTELFKLIVLCTVVCGFFVTETHAQSKSTKAKTTKSKSKGRLPRYFTHLKLEDEQKDEVFQIQADYKKQIAELTEQLAELKEEQQDALEDVLTRTQKTLYNKYVEGTMKVGDKIPTKTSSKKSSSSSKKSTKGKTSSTRKSKKK